MVLKLLDKRYVFSELVHKHTNKKFCMFNTYDIYAIVDVPESTLVLRYNANTLRMSFQDMVIENVKYDDYTPYLVDVELRDAKGCIYNRKYRISISPYGIIASKMYEHIFDVKQHQVESKCNKNISLVFGLYTKIKYKDIVVRYNRFGLFVEYRLSKTELTFIKPFNIGGVLIKAEIVRHPNRYYVECIEKSVNGNVHYVLFEVLKGCCEVWLISSPIHNGA